MRIVPLLLIGVLVLLCIGWVIFSEVNKNNFTNNLSPVAKQPLRDPSKVQQHITISSSADEQTETKLTPEKLQESSFEVRKPIAQKKQGAPDNYDWRQDTEPVPNELREQTNPWQNQEHVEKTANEDTLITNPETMDPDALWNAVHNQLIEQFGDIPEVYLFTDMNRKMAKHIPLTLDERIAGIEAALYLFPREGTRRYLQRLRKIRADVRAGKMKEPVWEYNRERRVQVR